MLLLSHKIFCRADSPDIIYPGKGQTLMTFCFDMRIVESRLGILATWVPFFHIETQWISKRNSSRTCTEIVVVLLNRLVSPTTEALSILILSDKYESE